MVFLSPRRLQLVLGSGQACPAGFLPKNHRPRTASDSNRGIICWLGGPPRGESARLLLDYYSGEMSSILFQKRDLLNVVHHA